MACDTLSNTGYGVECEPIIISYEDFAQVKADYELVRINQQKCGYKTKKFFSQNIFTKWFCCCIKVKDELNLQYHEMT